MHEERERGIVSGFAVFALKTVLRLTLHYLETVKKPPIWLVRDCAELIMQLIR